MRPLSNPFAAGLGRACGWLGVVMLLELITRAVVYGMAPATPAARALGGELGGPSFAATLVVALGLAVILSTAVVWLASMGVRERWALAEERYDSLAPIAVERIVVRAVMLTLVGWLVFAGIETTIHLRAGLGFHGLACLVGPLHRNALPVVGCLALLASALISAGGLVLAWMRRTVRRFATPRVSPPERFSFARVSVASLERRAPLIHGAGPRGPPAPAV